MTDSVKDENSKIIQVKDSFDLERFKSEPERSEPQQSIDEDKKSSGMPSTCSRDTSIVSHLSDYSYYCDSD